MSYNPLKEQSKNAVMVELKAISDTIHKRPAGGEESQSEPELDENDASKLISPESSGEYNDYEEVLKVIGFGLAHILLLLGTGVALSSDAVEVLSISFALPIIRRATELDISNWQNGLLSSVIFIGMLIGGYTWGGIADISGRRLTLITSLSVNGIFGALSAFSPNFYVLLLFRFISGIGVGGSLPVIMAYNSEFVGTKYRGPYLGALSMFWMIGALLCGGFAWGLLPLNTSLSLGSYEFHSWRMYLLVSALPSLSGAILFIIMPESPRFLLEVGNEQRAIKILKHFYSLNYFHKRKTIRHFPVKTIKLPNLPSISSDTSNQTVVSFKGRLLAALGNFREILRRTTKLFQRSLVRSTLLLLVIYFCLAFGSYGVTLWYPTYVDKLSREGLESSIQHQDCNRTLSNYSLTSEAQSAYEEIFCACPSTGFRNVTLNNLTIPSWWMTGSLLSGVDLTRVRFGGVWFRNVSMDTITFNQATINNAYLLETSLRSVTFTNVTFNNSVLCGINSNSLSFASTVFINSSLNQIPLDGLSDDTLKELFLNQSLIGDDDPVSCIQEFPGHVETCFIQPAEVDLRKEYFYDFIIAASAFPGNIGSAIAVYFFRRSYWLGFSFLLSTVTVFLLFFVHTEVFAVIILCFFKAITIPGWNVTSLLVAEIYPTSLRTTTSGVLLLLARIGAIIGTYVFGAFANTDLISIPILMTAGVLLVSAIASVFLPKTNRTTPLQ